MPPTVDEYLAMRQAKDLSLSSKFLRLFAASALIGFLAVTGSSIQLELSSGRYLGLISDLTLGADALLDMRQTLDDLKLYARTVEQSRSIQRSPNILLIPGTSSLAHLRENVEAAVLHLPEEAVAALDQIGLASSGEMGSTTRTPERQAAR